MINKKYRFHSRGGVRNTYQKGKTIRSPKMSLVYTDNDHNFTRFAVVVSKKIDKTAIGRNRIRRRIYEAIRVNLDKIPQKKDYIFVVYDKNLKTIPFKDIESIIANLITQSMI